LVADDDPAVLESLAELLSSLDCETVAASSCASAIAQLRKERVDAAFLDLRMPGGDTLDALAEILRMDPDLPVVIMTGFGTIELAVGAMRAGAYDFMEKPVRRELLSAVLDRALRHRTLQKELTRLRSQNLQNGLDAICGTSAEIAQLKQDILKVAAAPATTALILGESGCGKELVARAIHASSARSRGPWVAVNCGALSPALLEAELFGYERGAFTGANPAGRDGLFEQATSGTLFLDEVAELGVGLQSKLLRALEERCIRRIGASRDTAVDVRVVAATNRDIKRLVAEGAFRADLYYRLAVVTLAIAPLRDRTVDILDLAQRFLLQFQTLRGPRKLTFGDDARAALENYRWPGNVRELRNAVERACIVCNGSTVTARDLGIDDSQGAPLQDREIQPLAAVERETIARALRSTGGNISKAARALGIHRATLHRKLEDHDLAAAVHSAVPGSYL
jgi:two-component system response regulator HydG